MKLISKEAKCEEKNSRNENYAISEMKPKCKVNSMGDMSINKKISLHFYRKYE